MLHSDKMPTQAQSYKSLHLDKYEHNLAQKMDAKQQFMTAICLTLSHKAQAYFSKSLIQEA